MTQFRTENLTVGYHGIPLIRDINIAIEKGGILCLIGPNGSGKSTILKSITQHLTSLGGAVFVEQRNTMRMSNRTLAQNLSVLLTDRISPDLMTCEEVVAVGRYPYTNHFGKLSSEDQAIVEDSLRKVNALDLKDRYFTTLSDGQRQRILLAKALCQQPKVIVLDEPTSFLDIRHKIELLSILRTMCLQNGLTVVISLHEVDLAAKLADVVVLIRDDVIRTYGAPEDVLTDQCIRGLYEIREGHFDMLLGSIELPADKENPEVFVIAGEGTGAPLYRALQKKGIAFSTGILQQNDVDCYVARHLAAQLFAAPSFDAPTEQTRAQALESILGAQVVIDSGASVGPYNRHNEALLRAAAKRGIPCLHLRKEGQPAEDSFFHSVYDLMVRVSGILRVPARV